jgi:hypothetical protein
VRFKHIDNIAYFINRTKTNGLVTKPLYGFGPTIKPALASNQYEEYSGWSPSGRNCGHFRPLTAYTVTRHTLLEATPLVRNQDCVVAGLAQDVDMPSQAAVNGRSPLARALTVKKGPRGLKPVAVETAYQTPISVVALSGVKSRGRCSLHSLK